MRTTLAALASLALAASAPGCSRSPGATLPTPPPPITSSGLEPDEIPLAVDLRCPGDPGCKDVGDGTLEAAVALRDITPLVEPFVDTNGNGVFDKGEPFTDLNGNGAFDPVWMAGYDNGRMAWGVRDPTWLRCYVLRQNQTTLAHCVVDCVGYFQNEQAQIRADLDPSLGVDLVMMSATHVHETQDTTGLWGPDEVTTGLDPDYMRRIRVAAASAITEAVDNLRPAKMSIGSKQLIDPDHSLIPYISDTRDPVVIDYTMHLMQFDDARTGAPIVTVLNWAGHPDSAGSANHYITADYNYRLRADLALHTGSPVVFVNGDLGGQIGGGKVVPRYADGTSYPARYGIPFADAWGEGLAGKAMEIFDQRQAVDSPKLAFLHTQFNAHVENVAYQATYFAHDFNRPIFGYDPKKPLIRTAELDNAPLLTSEAAYITLGPASISTCPGELLPENFLGGYQGQFAGTYQFIDMTKPNAPDVTRAPQPPYLFDMMQGPPEHRMIYGATLDFLGYIIPRYDFVLDPLTPYLRDAPGDHYEETNSIGPRAEPEILGTMRQLVLQYNQDAAWAASQAAGKM